MHHFSSLRWLPVGWRRWEDKAGTWGNEDEHGKHKGQLERWGREHGPCRPCWCRDTGSVAAIGESMRSSTLCFVWMVLSLVWDWVVFCLVVVVFWLDSTYCRRGNEVVVGATKSKREILRCRKLLCLLLPY